MDYLVVMKNSVPGENGITWEHEARDTVEDYKLEAYVAERKKLWNSVEFTPKEN